MKLLSAALPRLRRLIPSGDAPITVLFAVLLVTLELAGRAAANDLQDGLAAFTLASGIALVAARHRRRAIPWVSWLGAKLTALGSLLDQAWFDYGLDLRGTPHIPARIPPVTWLLVACSVGWSIVACLVWAYVPGGWRDLARSSSYVIYLVGLLAVWAGLMMCTFISLYAVVQVFGAHLRALLRPTDRRGLDLGLIVAYVLLMLGAATLLPTIVIIGLFGLTLILALIGVIRSGSFEGPGLLWRSGPGRPIYSIPQWRVVSGMIGLITLDLTALILTAAGGRLFTTPELADPMPLTTLLGTVAAWMMPGLAASVALWLWAIHRSDPARRTPGQLHLIAGLQSVADREAATKILTGWNWQVDSIGRPQPGELAIELVPAEQSEAKEFDPRWPLKVSIDDLRSGEVRERLERRDEIHLRRQAFRGLASLFKRAIGERRTRGGGYWFAPQWWFQAGLEREEPEFNRQEQIAPARLVGPPFAWIFSVRVRQHFHQVFRAVQIDTIFVEDGISHRTFAKVLRAVFEIYDVHGGKRAVADHLFQGIPKVKVMVHEYSPGQPFRASRYNEPKFDELSRARVLHIFRDHGGEEADVDIPFDFSSEPSPALGVG